MNLTVVYPQWKGLKERESEYSDDDPRVKKFEKFSAMVYDKVDLVGRVKPRPVSQIYIARSGAWTPPWLDDDFFDLVTGPLGRGAKMFRALESIDLMKKRRIDVEEARAAGAKIREMMAASAGRKS